MRFKRLINTYFITIFFLLLNLLMGFFSYLLFYPLNIVELREFSVMEQSVAKGENVSFKLAFDKKLDYTPNISWFLIDSVVIPLNEGGVRRPLGLQEYDRQLYIPDLPVIAADQKYRLLVDIEYPVLNGLRTVSYTWVSNEFLITE